MDSIQYDTERDTLPSPALGADGDATPAAEGGLKASGAGEEGGQDAGEEGAEGILQRLRAIVAEQFPHYSAWEYVRRTIYLIVGLFVMSFGIALSIRAALGTSPISGIPYVLNLITGLTVGTTTIIFNVALVLLQVLLLRRRFQLFQLLQVGVAVLFGLMNDAALAALAWVQPAAYWQQWLLCIGSILIVALGVSFEVNAKLVTLPGEGVVLAVCKIAPIKFGAMKVINDVCLVIVAGALALIFLHELTGVREGTLAAAVFVGIIARQFNRFMKPVAERLLPDRRQASN